jgi:hypothetical protein
MNAYEEYQLNMTKFGNELKEAGRFLVMAGETAHAMAAVLTASESEVPPAMQIHKIYAHPDSGPIADDRATEPAPAPEGDYGPEDPAAESVPNPDLRSLSARVPSTTPDAPPCRVAIMCGAYVGETADVLFAKRGKKLRVRLDGTTREDDVFAADVVLLEGSSPLPVYAPKARAK